jgi:hypothetical protein
MGRTFTLRTLMTCLWPGLAPLWWRGVWSGLAEAVAFAFGLNLLLTATYVWPQWWAGAWLTLGWLSLGGVWLAGCWRGWRALPGLIESGPDPVSEGLFVEAQAEYLKGHWYDAEKRLEQLLNRRPRDAEGWLLLASLYRHTGRRDEALATLDRLETLSGARRWLLEITHERQRLEKPAAEEPLASSCGAAITE